MWLETASLPTFPDDLQILFTTKHVIQDKSLKFETISQQMNPHFAGVPLLGDTQVGQQQVGEMPNK